MHATAPLTSAGADAEAKKSEGKEAPSDMKINIQNDAIDITASVHDDYQPEKRDPLHAGAKGTVAWELESLARHFHPSVRAFAASMLHDARCEIDYRGNPIRDLSNAAFLDRFSYRNPKKKDRNALKKMDTVFGDQGRVARTGNAALSVAVNSVQFLDRAPRNIAENERFFHKFFKQRQASGRYAAPSRRKRDDWFEEDAAEEAFAQKLAHQLMRDAGGAGIDDDMGDLDLDYTDSESDEDEGDNITPKVGEGAEEEEEEEEVAWGGGAPRDSDDDDNDDSLDFGGEDENDDEFDFETMDEGSGKSQRKIRTHLQTPTSLQIFSTMLERMIRTQRRLHGRRGTNRVANASEAVALQRENLAREGDSIFYLQVIYRLAKLYLSKILESGEWRARSSLDSGRNRNQNCRAEAFAAGRSQYRALLFLALCLSRAFQSTIIQNGVQMFGMATRFSPEFLLLVSYQGQHCLRLAAGKRHRTTDPSAPKKQYEECSRERIAICSARTLQSTPWQASLEDWADLIGTRYPIAVQLPETLKVGYVGIHSTAKHFGE